MPTQTKPLPRLGYGLGFSNFQLTKLFKMEKPVINVTIKNLVGTLVIIGDNTNNTELEKVIKETLLLAISSVSGIQQENSDISEQQTKSPQNSN